MLTPTKATHAILDSSPEVKAQPSSAAIRAPIQDGQPLPPARRLVVLVPTTDVDEARFARRIWMLASTTRLDVLYVALVHEPDEESRVRRQLAMLAALTRDNLFRVETQLQSVRNWTKAIRPLLRDGDLIVCHAEQTIDTFGIRRRPLAPELVAAREAPVYVLSGLSVAATRLRPDRFAGLIRDAMPYVIVAGFFGFQTQAVGLTQGWGTPAFLCLSVLVEFGLIWIWMLITS